MTDDLRLAIRRATLADDRVLLNALVRQANLSAHDRFTIGNAAADLVEQVRQSSDPGAMESFLAEYGLSTDEGVALMCLAEALLRVPDNETVDDLIRDKIAPHDWASHVGDSGSILINASTWALMLTGKVLDDDDPGVVGTLQAMVRRLGEPVVRVAVKRAMQELGSQFVLGETIEQATDRATQMMARGYTYSYDMLGEAARTESDARRYYESYLNAIEALGSQAQSDDIRQNPGISVKLSALHPRYETLCAASCVPLLTDRLLNLALRASRLRLGLNVDAEEADRLDLSLDIIEGVLTDQRLANWNGFGVVIQAYGKRAGALINWLIHLSESLGRRVMVRLVKGAYWDTEIKQAQVLGLSAYPVYCRKADTDVSYIACARKLLDAREQLYPQFATHNAHTICSVLQLAGDEPRGFEFQRLHGMGESLHEIVLKQFNTPCRIYAPVGAHEDLLAYLVRRLLENGANSSFVNQIVDESVSAVEIAADPFKSSTDTQDGSATTLPLPLPQEIYQPWRRNSRGWNPGDPVHLQRIASLQKPMLAPYRFNGALAGKVGVTTVCNPANLAEVVGYQLPTQPEQVADIVGSAKNAQPDWAALPVAERVLMLNRAADLIESNAAEFFVLLAREAGKTLPDSISEIREAVDFLRYYAVQAGELDTQRSARGVIVCISPWNFPLAIFAGQIAAALVTGNTVVAKPAEQTGLIAQRVVHCLHEAGVPDSVLQLVVGDGPTIGAALTAQPDIAGVCFTGSTEVATLIEAQLAISAAPDAMLIAETGGLNAMIVDSTALTEQAVRDIVASAFQSAGQRCSALRIVYVQDEKRDALIAMLKGAMDELCIGDPLTYRTDIGPVIDADAKAGISRYVDKKWQDGKVIKSLTVAQDIAGSGHFVAPVLIESDGIADLEQEIFGPVLHVAGFRSDEIDGVVDAINQRGYGLTFGLHSRIDERVQRVVSRIRVGNVYINRNQIGAVVGSQPFGGEGLSGTGPKAGGPHYLARFTRPPVLNDAGGTLASSADTTAENRVSAHVIDEAFSKFEPSLWPQTRNRIGILRSVLRGRAARSMAAAAAIDMSPTELPGPTGESNRLSLRPLGRVLCLASDPVVLLSHVVQALRCGNCVVAVAESARATVSFLQAPGIPLAVFDGHVPIVELVRANLDAVALDASPTAGHEALAMASAIRRALAKARNPDTNGPRLITGQIDPARFASERAVCIDTTAAGGNAALLAGSTA